MWPSLNSPHWGLPYRAQPSFEVARAAMSAQPTDLAGHPSASAIGFHVAMTTGERTSGGASPTSLFSPPPSPCFSAQRAFRTSTRREDAGDQTWASLWPARIASIDSADPSATASIRIGFPPAVFGLAA